MVFNSLQHKIRFARLMARAEKSLDDVRTGALFYIVAGNDYLFERVNAIYNFVYCVADASVQHSGYIEYQSTPWWLLEGAFACYFEVYPVDMQLVFAGCTSEDIDLLTQAFKLRYATVS